MAVIQERTKSDGKTSYRVLVRIKGYPAQSATFKRITDAKSWAVQTEADIRQGRHFRTYEAKKHTLEDAIKRYNETYVDSLKTSKDRKRQLGWWNKQIGKHTLAEVTPALITQKRDELSKGNRSASTVNRYLAALSHLFTVIAKEWQWVEANPMNQVSKLKEPRGRVRFLDKDERERLLEACKSSKNSDLYLAVRLALATGARRSEIWNLEWSQIDFDRETIILHETKNNDRRKLHISGEVYEMLLEKSKIRRLDTNRLFPGKLDPTKPFDFTQPWRTALKQAKIEDFKWHDLRHTTASYLAMNGATPGEIAGALGHRTLQMVKRYSHLSEDHISSVLQSMNQKVFGG